MDPDLSAVSEVRSVSSIDELRSALQAIVVEMQEEQLRQLRAEGLPEVFISAVSAAGRLLSGQQIERDLAGIWAAMADSSAMGG